MSTSWTMDARPADLRYHSRLRIRNALAQRRILQEHASSGETKPSSSWMIATTGREFSAMFGSGGTVWARLAGLLTDIGVTVHPTGSSEA